MIEAHMEETDLVHLYRLLRLASERRKNEADSEHDREPDPPHGHLVEGGLPRSLADEGCPEERAAWGGHGLLDHLVRSQKQRLRDRQTECLGGLEVDGQLELRRLLDGQIRRLGSVQGLVEGDW